MDEDVFVERDASRWAKEEINSSLSGVESSRTCWNRA